MLESKLEAYFRLRVRRDLQGISFKLAPTTIGMPDRLILTRRGMYLVELKTETGVVAPAQRVLHERIRALGIPVAVLYGREDVDLWVDLEEMQHG